jgi:NCS2 family nucleobase:cation symporter-2
MSRHVVTIGAVVLVALSLLPQVAAVLAAIPPAVLGGGVLVLFGMVAAIGIQLLLEDGLDTRGLLIVALSVGLGRGIAAAPDAVDRVSGEWGALFDSGIVVAAVVAVLLDLVLPGRKDRTAEPPSPAEVVVDDVAVEHRPPAV